MSVSSPNTSPGDSIVLLSIPEDILAHTLSFLPPKDALYSGYTSSKLSRVCQRRALWREFCTQLWSDKVHVPQRFREMLRENAKDAYFHSVIDSKRKHLTEDELTSSVWRFRFKQCAGEHWIANDAYWRGEAPTTVTFNADRTIVRSTMNLRWRWEFARRTRCRQGPRGSFIRIMRPDGGTVPTYVVGRHSNWGFIMESCWALCTSFDMPPAGEDPELEDDNLSVDSDEQIDEVLSYNFGLAHNQVLAAFDGAADDDEGTDDQQQSPNPAAFGGALQHLLHAAGAGVGNNASNVSLADGVTDDDSISDEDDSEESDDDMAVCLGHLMSDESDADEESPSDDASSAS